jgi:hypothetical protein
MRARTGSSAMVRQHAGKQASNGTALVSRCSGKPIATASTVVFGEEDRLALDDVQSLVNWWIKLR